MRSKNEYDKSPLNYVGGKYKILPQILQYFPENIDIMVDLFAGGCDVCCNVSANKIYANDINKYIIEIYQKIQEMTIEDILSYIDDTIKLSNLSINNGEAFLVFREKYNKTVNKNPLDLYILMCYAFNYQCRFNNKHEFNSSFGKNRSSFNSAIRNNLIKFHKNIKEIEFSALNFIDFDTSILKENDFLYADPPYLISTGYYNDGKRGFEGWSKNDDILLFELLDNLNDRGVKFALSNVMEHKGIRNENLIKWVEKYKIQYIKFDYKNSSYHGKNIDKKTIEVLITNY